MKAATFDLGGAIRALAQDLAAAEAEIAAFAGAGGGPLSQQQGTSPGAPALSVDRAELDLPVYLGVDPATSRPLATAPRRNIVFARTALLGRVRVVLVRQEKPPSTP